jgi:hypothetical protein
MSILFYDLYHTLSEEIPESNEYATPESRPEESNRDKRHHLHAEYSCWDRDKVPDYGYESPDKCIDAIIFEKEVFRFFVLLWSDEDISTILLEEWLPEPPSEYIVVRECADD